MPRRKTEVLENNLKDTYIVEKSRPLFSLWRSEISLSEFKILDVYLSRIDSRDPEHKTVRFSKAEFQKLLEVSSLSADALKERLKHLISCQVEVESENKSGVVNLFSAAFCERDDYEQYFIELTCTPEAMKYFFNIEEIGYLRYKLRNIIHITSRFSYVMFMYIEMNRFRKSWTVDIDELKSILSCDDSEFYADYKYFNQRVLKRCYDELTAKTELRYSYTPNRIGHKYRTITFTVETLSDKLLQAAVPAAETANITELDDKPQRSYSNDYIDFLADAVNREFDETEIKVLSDLANTKDLTDYDRNNNMQTAKYNYLLAMYNKLNLYGKKHKIKDRFAYLKKIIEQDGAEN